MAVLAFVTIRDILYLHQHCSFNFIAFIHLKSSLPKSTAKVLAYKALDRDFDNTWTDWAIDLLVDGFETEHLVILAGMSEPFDYFEMQSLTTKTLNELGLDYSNKIKSVYGYIAYLINLCFNNQITPITVLAEARDLYLELHYEQSLQRFYFLYYAKTDLIQDEVQWYIEDVDRSNIDEMVHACFSAWMETYPKINN
jgi:hypothetical protein